MPEPWVSQNAVLDALCLQMGGKDPADFTERQLAIFLAACQNAAVRATEEIRTVLKRHAWSDAKVESWDGRVAYTTDLATWHAIGKLGAFFEFNTTAAEALNCLKFLDEFAQLSIAGVSQPPDADAAIGGVATGTLDAVTDVTCDPHHLFRRW